MYRAKALVAEQRAKETSDPTARQDWEELAIEWHTMASIAARVGSENLPTMSDSGQAEWTCCCGPGLRKIRGMDMDRLSAADVFLMVAIMSVAFLTEIALFILIGMIWKNRALWAARLSCLLHLKVYVTYPTIERLL
jgi:hypothetical protein